MDAVLHPILLLLLVVAGTWIVGLVVRGPEQRMLHDGVRHLGLKARHALVPRTAVARGRVDGLELRVKYVDTQPAKKQDQPWSPPSATVAVRITLPQPLPAGLRLRTMGPSQHLLELLGAQDLQVGDPRLDEALRVACKDPEEARVLLSEPALRDVLLRIAGHLANSLEVDAEEVRLVRDGPLAVDARPVVDHALELARALVAAQQQPWLRLAASLGLAGGEAGRDGRRRLEGIVDGVPVELRLVPAEGEAPPRTLIRARLQPPLPGDLRLRARAPGSPRAGLSTGNPVLDTAVVLHCADPAAARRLLAEDAVTGPLMELLHGQAGEGGEARVASALISLDHPGWSPVGVEARVQLVVEVARALQEAARQGRPAEAS